MTDPPNLTGIDTIFFQKNERKTQITIFFIYLKAAPLYSGQARSVQRLLSELVAFERHFKATLMVGEIASGTIERFPGAQKVVF